MSHGTVLFSEGQNTPGVTPGLNLRGMIPPSWDSRVKNIDRVWHLDQENTNSPTSSHFGRENGENDQKIHLCHFALNNEYNMNIDETKNGEPNETSHKAQFQKMTELDFFSTWVKN